MTSDAAILREALRAVAPGTPLREGLERIQRSHTGALIVLGYTPEVQAMCSGGFDLDIAFTAARLRELCKMDGAVIIDPDLWRIRKANVQLFPDPTIPTDESGMRHRTAQRTARQTHLPVLSLSASMRMISIYVGTEHRLVEEPEALLSRANLAVDTLDRYSQRLDEVLQTLTILEMRDSATVRDVATVMQRMEMIRRITSEITEYLEELGSEGRLLALQVEDLVRGSASERALVMRDYIRDPADVARVEAELSSLGSERIVDLTAIANILGLDVYEVADLDREIMPRGVRALSLVPHLSWNAIKAVSAHFTNLRRPVAFLDDEMLVTKRSNLSQVRHDDDLARCGKTLQTRTNLRCGLPADTSVNLVEDKRRRGLGAPQHQLQGEHDARELATRGPLTERTGRSMRMRLQAEDNALTPVGRRLRCLEVNVERGVGH